MRPRSAYEDGHDHIVDVPSYAVMMKFIGHYETHVCRIPAETPIDLEF